MLFDVDSDYGEKTDVLAQHGEVARDLANRFDSWWSSLGPCLVNEKAVGPAINPFKVLYWRQFGGQPNAEDLRLMDMDQNPRHPAAASGLNGGRVGERARDCLTPRWRQATKDT